MNRFRLLSAAGRLLLGAFVLWQVAFLGAALLANAGQALGDPLGVRRAVENDVLRRYAEATGQRQSWELFAPDVADRFAFVGVELRWDDDGLAPDPAPARVRPGAVPPVAPVFLPGKVEPADLNAFVRLGGCRIRKYETFIALDEVEGEVRFDAPAGDDPRPDARLVYPDVANQMHAYLRWRLAEFRRERPDLPPPTQVRLWVHSYRIPEPPGPEPWRWQDQGWDLVGVWVPESDAPAAGKE
jgi:hypothetical protein